MAQVALVQKLVHSLLISVEVPSAGISPPVQLVLDVLINLLVIEVLSEAFEVQLREVGEDVPQVLNCVRHCVGTHVLIQLIDDL